MHFYKSGKTNESTSVLVTAHYRSSMEMSDVVMFRYQSTVILVMTGCSYFLSFIF